MYSGAKYDMVTQVPAGCVCAVPGLVNTYGRQGIGACPDGELPSLEPVLSYKVMYPTDVDAVTMVSKLRLLEEEDPSSRCSGMRPQERYTSRSWGRYSLR